mgnify:CR=1 FL=1
MFSSAANALQPPNFSALLGVLMSCTLGTGLSFLLCYVFVITLIVEPNKKHMQLDIPADVEFVDSGLLLTSFRTCS